MSTHPHVDKANAYAQRVVAGDIKASKYVVLSCQRHIDDIRKSKAKGYPYYFDAQKAERACKFIETFKHTKGKWAAKGENLILEPWQCFLVCSIFGWLRVSDGLRRFRRALLFVPRKNGKALAVDTKIPTPSGFKLMGDLSVGDVVFGADGSPKNIIATSDVMVDRPCFKVSFSNGDEIIADENHLWVTDSRSDRDRLKGRNGKTKGPKPSVKTTGEIYKTLKCRNENNHRIQMNGPVFGYHSDVPIHPYVLGAWLGDGTSANSQITIGEKDEIEFSNIFESFGYPIRKLSGKYQYTFSTGRTQKDRDSSIMHDLRSLDVLGNKHIPEQYLFLSIEQRTLLLQGLMDTDGTCSKSGQCTYAGINYNLCNGVYRLALSLGLRASIIRKPAKINGRFICDQWAVSFFAFKDRPVFRLLRKLERQKNVPSLKTRSSHVVITDCLPVDSVPVRCIQVEGDGLFLAGERYITTHNSALAATIGLYMLSADAEHGAEVYSGATTEKQAWEVFRPAKIMAEKQQDFCDWYGVNVNASAIVVEENGSRFEAVVGKPGDGASPSCAIIDEYHEHKTDELLDTMETGMGAREQPLLLMITTAGDNVSGPCYQMQLDAQKMLEGVTDDDMTFALIYGIDAGDKWDDIEAAKKANPNFGVSVGEDFIFARLADAKNNARKQSTYQTKHLNRWVGARNAFFNVERWKECGDNSLSFADFHGKKCYIGLDLASKVDIAALEILFPVGDNDYVRFGRYYLPETAVESGANPHYAGWMRDGWLTITDGEIIDFRRIMDDILDISSVCEVAEVAYDPHQATMLVTALMNEGVPVVEMRPTVLNFSEPMKIVEGLIRARKLRHNDDPVMTWMVSNVVATTDAKDNVYPRKERDENKIDGVVALLMAMGRAMNNANTEGDIDGWLSNPVL